MDAARSLCRPLQGLAHLFAAQSHDWRRGLLICRASGALPIWSSEMSRFFLCLLLIALCGGVAAAQVKPFPELARNFDYDNKAPLDVKEIGVDDRDGVKLYDLTYASPKGGRVTAYLVVPAGKGPFAGLVFGHWGPGNRTEFLPEATLYARAGAVSLLVDYPWVRPAPWRKKLKQADDPEWDHAAFVQAVVDLRRGIDLVAARPDVDSNRLAYVGHSWGAQWGAILSAVEPRLKGGA